MPEFCTCGAELPPDALFCHKCGKPQREIAVQEEASEAVEPVLPPAFTPAAQGAPGFRNPIAVRVGLMLASLAALLSALPLISLLFPLWFFTAGFMSPFAYRRRTGQRLSMRNGARMGWVTGAMIFLITTVLTTISEILNPAGGFIAAMREQIRNMPVSDPKMQPTLEAFQTPLGFGFILLFVLLFTFAFTMLLCTAGGALGAKVAEDKR